MLAGHRAALLRAAASADPVDARECFTDIGVPAGSDADATDATVDRGRDGGESGSAFGRFDCAIVLIDDYEEIQHASRHHQKDHDHENRFNGYGPGLIKAKVLEHLSVP